MNSQERNKAVESWSCSSIIDTSIDAGFLSRLFSSQSKGINKLLKLKKEKD